MKLIFKIVAIIIPFSGDAKLASSLCSLSCIPTLSHIQRLREETRSQPWTYRVTLLVGAVTIVNDWEIGATSINWDVNPVAWMSWTLTW